MLSGGIRLLHRLLQVLQNTCRCERSEAICGWQRAAS